MKLALAALLATLLVPAATPAADKITRETFGSGGRTRP